MFDDNSECPFYVLIEDAQIDRVTPLKLGWNKQFLVYYGSSDNCKHKFDKVYYREVDTLPCLQPVVES